MEHVDNPSRFRLKVVRCTAWALGVVGVVAGCHAHAHNKVVFEENWGHHPSARESPKTVKTCTWRTPYVRSPPLSGARCGPQVGPVTARALDRLVVQTRPSGGMRTKPPVCAHVGGSTEPAPTLCARQPPRLRSMFRHGRAGGFTPSRHGARGRVQVRHACATPWCWDGWFARANWARAFPTALWPARGKPRNSTTRGQFPTGLGGGSKVCPCSCCRPVNICPNPRPARGTAKFGSAHSGKVGYYPHRWGYQGVRC